MSNVLLLVADCLRYDSIGQNFLPNYPWDRFERHHTVGNVSDANFLSIFTGKTPIETSVRFMVDPEWNCPWITLPQILSGAGYQTFGCGWHWAYQERGFQEWVSVGPNVLGEKQIDELWAWLGKGQKKKEGPWFAYIRTVDCHHIYTNGSYESAVQYTEALSDALIKELQAEFSDTAVIITGDHGEDLGQHGIDMHSAGLWETLVHVPLLVLRPGSSTGKRWTDLTQHPQLFRTILDLAEVKAPTLAVESVYQLQRELLYFDSEGQYPGVGVCRQIGFVTARHKYWKSISPKGSLKEFLYDLKQDPKEMRNLVTEPQRLTKGLPGLLYHKASELAHRLLGGVSPSKLLARARSQIDDAFAADQSYTEEEAEAVQKFLRGIGYAP